MGTFKKASLNGDGTPLESPEKVTYATLNETDVIILTYRKLRKSKNPLLLLTFRI
tara:strand:- start:115 stop:279 length:165 start_codon:yes stop_codon:yes gene_type:complete